MKRIKNYIISVFLILIAILILQNYGLRDRLQKAKEDRGRLWQNLLEMEQQNKYLIVSHEEWRRQISKQYDSVLKLLRVKPKEVIRYEERVITQVERDTVYVPVKEISSLTWKISDTGPCFVWSGIANLTDIDSMLEVKRTGFFYKNETVDVLTRRVKWKFLFLRGYDRRRYDLHSTSECGGVQTKIIEVER